MQTVYLFLSSRPASQLKTLKAFELNQAVIMASRMITIATNQSIHRSGMVDTEGNEVKEEERVEAAVARFLKDVLVAKHGDVVSEIRNTKYWSGCFPTL